MVDQGDSLNGASRVAWWKRYLLPVVVASTLGALLGGPGYRAFEDPRADPMTGREGEAMEARIMSQSEGADYEIKLDYGKIEKRLDRMDARFTSLSSVVAKLPPEKLVERLTRAEEKLKYLERSCVKWADASTRKAK